MRLFITLAALTAAPMAMAQEAPCQSASTFSARRCAQAVTEALEAAEQSRETLAILAECDGYKKKRKFHRDGHFMTQGNALNCPFVFQG